MTPTMRAFDDEAGREWVATAQEEKTPRHHGRWVLVFHPAGEEEEALPFPEVRWQTRETAERTVHTMARSELLRRLEIVLRRAGQEKRLPQSPR